MRWVYAAAIAAFLIDQISKYVVVFVMDLVQIRSIDVLPPLLNFRYGENRGINFGLFDGGSEAARWFLIAVAIVICVAVLIWARRTVMTGWAYGAAGLLPGAPLGGSSEEPPASLLGDVCAAKSRKS